MPSINDLHVDAILSKLSIKYRNEIFIGSMVLPEIRVQKRSNKFFVYDKKDAFSLQPTSVGPKAQPNEVGWNVSTDNYSVSDYALADYIPLEASGNADIPLNVRVDTNEILNEWLDLDREKRIADIVFAAATYDAANKKDLSAAKWNTSSAAPIANIQDAVNGCFIRANTLVFGHDAWELFRTLDPVLDAVKSSTRMQDSPGGLAKRQEIAELFEVDHVLVGRARYNKKKKGQTPTYARVWGASVAALHVRPSPTVRSITFGASFSEQTKMTQTMMDYKRGVKGAEYVKVGYNCDEKIIAKDLGYLLYNLK